MTQDAPLLTLAPDAPLPALRADLVAQVDEGVAFVVDPWRGEIFELNATAFEAFEACRRRDTLAAAADAIAARHEAPRERVIKDLTKLVAAFRENGLLAA